MTTINITEFSKGRGRLERALAQIGTVTLDDLRSLLHLSDLIRDCGGCCPAEVLADSPVFVGGVRLYMPSVAALEYLSQNLPKWFGEDDVDADIFTALVFSLSRRPRELSTMNSRGTALRRLKAFKKRLACTVEELMTAVAHAMQGFPVTAKSDPGDESNQAALISWGAQLAKEYGGTFTGWIWDQSAQRVLWLAREEANNSADGTSPGKIQATLAFTQKVKELREANNEQ